VTTKSIASPIAESYGSTVSDPGNKEQNSKYSDLRKSLERTPKIQALYGILASGSIT